MTTEETPRPLCAEDFEPLIGREARFGDIAFPLTLDEVERPRGPMPAGMPREPFTLCFSSPRGESYLMDGLYQCDFGGGKVFEIYLNPIQTYDPKRQDYQAVFN